MWNTHIYHEWLDYIRIHQKLFLAPALFGQGDWLEPFGFIKPGDSWCNLDSWDGSHGILKEEWKASGLLLIR